MDIVADLFKIAGLRRRVCDYHTLDNNSSVGFHCPKSLHFHLALKGQTYIWLGDKKISLNPGDLVLITRGQPHILTSSEEKVKPAAAKNICDISVRKTLSADHNYGIVSGAYTFWNDPVHPFFFELPTTFKISTTNLSGLDPLVLTTQLLSNEVNCKDHASETAISGLIDVLFTQILRKVISKESATQKTWSHAISNSSVRGVIDLMHAEYKQDWTLESLSKRAGMSRVSLNDKFKLSLGTTPIQYLTVLRMQKATQLLSETEDNLDHIADKVGYKDAFGFSKAFKKATGKSPSEYRKLRFAD